MKTLYGPKIKVELDKTQIFPEDPGQGTPVLVVLDSGETASWNCAMNEAEVDGVPLNEKQTRWLDSVTSEVEDWMKENGV